MRRIRSGLVIAVILICCGVFFFPKARVVGGLRGGPVAPNATAYREDYRCIGVKYDFCPNWPDYGCDYLCFGMSTGRVCVHERYDPVHGIVRSPAACEGPAAPRWGFPGLTHP